jgi:ribosomal protein L13E
VAWAGLTVFGVALGAFTSITFSPQVGAGIGITLGYLSWIGLMALDIRRTGIDVQALKDRFTPVQTIETSKETLEWLQKRMPPGIGS